MTNSKLQLKSLRSKIDQAGYLYEHNECAQALDLYFEIKEELDAKGATSSFICWRIACCFDRNEQHEDALKAVSAALEMDPVNGFAIQSRRVIVNNIANHMDLDNRSRGYQQVENYWNLLVEYGVADTVSQKCYIEALIGMNRIKEAKAEIEGARRINPIDDEISCFISRIEAIEGGAGTIIEELL